MQDMRRVTPVCFVALCLSISLCVGGTLRVTTWNMEWFPTGSPRPVASEVEAQRIAQAASHLNVLRPDILLLQEIRDWETCEKLARALEPQKYQVLVCSAFRDAFGITRQQVAILSKF